MRRLDSMTTRRVPCAVWTGLISGWLGVMTAAVAVFAQGAGPLTAQTAAPQPGPVLRTDTNLVLVDVVVTERDKAVHGIDKAKFQVFEDGKEQPIVALDERKAEDAGALAKPLVLPPHTYRNVPQYRAGGAVNVLLLDGLNTPLVDQARTRLQMIDYMSKIPPGTPMAIFTLASRLRLVQGFTSDPATLAAALKSGKGTPSQSIVLDTPGSNDSVADQISDAGASPGAVASMQQFEADTAAFQTDRRVRMTLDALQQLGRYLNGIPGRKNLIWFSGSFPVSLDPDSSLSNPFSAMRSYAGDLQDTSVLLADARVAVYPVDARGLMNLPTYDVSYKAPSSSNRNARMASDNQKFTSQNQAEHASMTQLADATGGRAFVNTNDFKGAIAGAIDDGGSYYTIGYVPAVKMDGAFHKIKVKVNGGSYQLAYRRGYFADRQKPPDSPNGALIAVATQRGAPPATQVIFDARVLPLDDPAFQAQAGAASGLANGPGGLMTTSLKGPTKRYVVDLRLGVPTLAYTTGVDGVRMATVELILVGYDADGARLNYVDRGLGLKLSAEHYAQLLATGFPLRAVIDLPAGQVFLRIAVRDVTAAKIGSMEVPLMVAKK